MSMLKKKIFKSLAVASIAALVYGGHYIYYYQNKFLMVESSVEEDWNKLAFDDILELKNAFNQSYYYLNQGSQSYAFVSEDGKYVVKFFKDPQYVQSLWWSYLPKISDVVEFQNEKSEQRKKLVGHFTESGKIAFENLKEETGLIYFHSNKNDIPRLLSIYDHMGVRHLINLNLFLFSIQKRAEMLCSSLLKCKELGDLSKAKNIIINVLNLFYNLSQKGLVDRDNNFMNNIGIIDGTSPLLIDLGYFEKNDQVKIPLIYYQKLFNKTEDLTQWLEKGYPELAIFLNNELENKMGKFYMSTKRMSEARQNGGDMNALMVEYFNAVISENK